MPARPPLRNPNRRRSALAPSAACRESCTSGKAGGLICEPLKAVWPATPARFLFEHLQLIESTIFFLLLSDVISHLRLVPPHRRHVIAPRPKIQPNKVLRLDVPHHPGYRILRRDRQHHVNMIAHQMPFGMNTTWYLHSHFVCFRFSLLLFTLASSPLSHERFTGLEAFSRLP